jgi:hypothetical protein
MHMARVLDDRGIDGRRLPNHIVKVRMETDKKWPLARSGDGLVAERPVLRPLVPIVEGMFALPVNEAHCERVIGALHGMICPFAFNMSEATIMARLSARGE